MTTVTTKLILKLDNADGHDETIQSNVTTTMRAAIAAGSFTAGTPATIDLASVFIETEVENTGALTDIASFCEEADKHTKSCWAVTYQLDNSNVEHCEVLLWVRDEGAWYRFLPHSGRKRVGHHWSLFDSDPALGAHIVSVRQI